MAKSTKKTMSISSLVVKTDLNVRNVANYDIPAMRQGILDRGRITDPIHIRAGDNVVLRGNRRTLAGQELMADGQTPAEVVEALKKVDVIVHEVEAGSSEELSIILDHGDQKGLARSEVLEAVWRLDRQFKTEKEIGMLLYMALAQYSGNAGKAQEAATIKDLKARQDFIGKWLHGTLGNYMLSSAKMGPYVREQMMNTHLAEDKLLGDKTVEIKMSRDRITKLSAAKSADSKEKGGKGWDPVGGGETFNALLQQFKDEDAGRATAEKSSRPTVKELTDKADAFSSATVRAALLTAAGDKEAAKNLSDLDTAAARAAMVFEVLSKGAPQIKDPAVKALINAILGTGPVGEVEVALAQFTA
jgi:hypothetical protein